MSRLTEEHAARRILPSNRFDCELPPDVRTELNRPKRPRILGRQKTATLNAGANWRLYLVLLVCAATLGGSIATWRQVETAERARNKAISQPSLAPQPAPTPITPMPGLASRWKEYLANNPPAPRAALVKLPPPRARRLDAEWMLPSSGNRLGDTWVVGNTPWVWIWAPGATRADWIFRIRMSVRRNFEMGGKLDAQNDCLGFRWIAEHIDHLRALEQRVLFPNQLVSSYDLHSILRH